MDFLTAILTALLSSAEVQDAILAVFSAALLWLLRRPVLMFIEAKHRDALHEAIISAVESGIKLGPKEGMETLQAHVMLHLRQSVPDAMKALAPSNSVINRLIERYAREALVKLGEPK
jgi:hypothetical protein